MASCYRSRIKQRLVKVRMRGMQMIVTRMRGGMRLSRFCLRLRMKLRMGVRQGSS